MTRWQAAGIWSALTLCMVAPAFRAPALSGADLAKIKAVYPQISSPVSTASARFILDPQIRRPDASTEIETKVDSARQVLAMRNADLAKTEVELSMRTATWQLRAAELVSANVSLAEQKQQVSDLPQKTSSMSAGERATEFGSTLNGLASAQKRWTSATDVFTAATTDRDRAKSARDEAATASSEAQAGTNAALGERQAWLSETLQTHPERMGLVVQRGAVNLRFRDDASGDQIINILKKYEKSDQLRVVSAVQSIALFFARLDPRDESDQKALDRQRDVISRLRAETPVLSAYENVLLGGTSAPPLSHPPPAGYDWFAGPVSGMPNGTAAARALHFPEAWNFSDAIQARGLKVVPVGVVDEGFIEHTDLDMTIVHPKNTERAHHGNHVAGIIAARWNNGEGVDGGCPFAHVTAAAPELAPLSGQPVEEHRVPFDGFIQEVDAMAALGPRVINLSVGYNWNDDGHSFNPDAPDTPDEPAAEVKIKNAIKGLLTSQGTDVRDMLRKYSSDHVFIVVSAAGNDCGFADCTRTATWTSPFNWAALGDDNPLHPRSNNVLVVQANTSDGASTRLNNCNVGATIAAPGEQVMSTIESGYASESGTSMAAPEITALIALMFAYNKDLTVDDVRRILAVGQPQPSMPNAFLALCQSKPADCAHDLADLDRNGTVDMADFKIFADEMKDYEKGMALVPHSFTIDLNRNGPIDANDAFYPRCDLNGDGVLSEDRTAPLPLGGIVKDYTDLGVMMAAWQDRDPRFPASQLPSRLAAWPLTPQGFAPFP